jgi:purine-binding chemotaxis protein CheW
MTAAVTTQGAKEEREFVTVIVDGQLFGIPVLDVQDILNPQRIVRIPLSPPQVAGSLNLRGRIVTAIDLRVRLGLPPVANAGAAMSIVAEHGGELYSLLVDQVGEVLRLGDDAWERNLTTMSPALRAVCDGVYRLDGRLLLVLDVSRVLGLGQRAEAA